MIAYHFYHALEIRYGDLDPQGHVNNARYLSYIEQARVAYIQNLGLWDGRSWLDIGIILANVNMNFKAPLLFGTALKVGVRVSRLGNKSLTMVYSLVDSTNGKEIADATTVLVTFDYHSQHSTPIPVKWRQTILNFEDGNCVEDG